MKDINYDQRSKQYNSFLKIQPQRLAFCSNSKIRLKSGKPCASASIVSGEEILFFNKLALRSERKKKVRKCLNFSFQLWNPLNLFQAFKLIYPNYSIPLSNSLTILFHDSMTLLFSLCVQPSKLAKPGVSLLLSSLVRFLQALPWLPRSVHLQQLPK